MTDQLTRHHALSPRRRPSALFASALVAVLTSFSFWARPQEKQTPDPLSPEDMGRAQSLDIISVPTPGEFFAAINKVSAIDWASFRRDPPPTNLTDRSQIALNVGGLVADGYIAVEGQDSQGVKNVGRDIIALAKALGVSDQVIARGGSISDFAENSEWSALEEEFEATQNEVKKALEAQLDEPLILLVTLGGWLRGTEVAASAIAENYSPEAARLLRQPALAAYLRGKLDLLPERILRDPIVQEVRQRIIAIERLVTIPREETPSIELVGKVRDEAAEALAAVVRRPR